MNRIEEALYQYKSYTGKFPNSMDVLIGNRPLRKQWKKDSWGTNYKLNSNQSLILTFMSAGSDKSFGTEDDLIRKLK